MNNPLTPAGIEPATFRKCVILTYVSSLTGWVNVRIMKDGLHFRGHAYNRSKVVYFEIVHNRIFKFQLKYTTQYISHLQSLALPIQQYTKTKILTFISHLQSSKYKYILKLL